ncbi:hypothetical protein SKAU_G00202240 [Synaphobranchus kaupii]|uniref:Uncharacterized protein n=1 Tax=Synaphobranchus kaupii TaxID=118154 RepID=A0A9Q1IYI2_SYNKA|nr:hypothetical protein SKAU_G00202240 [Synaphobranchus kaupii]
MGLANHALRLAVKSDLPRGTRRSAPFAGVYHLHPLGRLRISGYCGLESQRRESPRRSGDVLDVWPLIIGAGSRTGGVTIRRRSSFITQREGREGGPHRGAFLYVTLATAPADTWRLSVLREVT